MTNSNDPYVPVMHSVWTDHWRVPLWVEGDTYRLCVGKNSYRYFRDETLPEEIKSALGMINAFPPNDVPIWDVNPINAYINAQDPKLDTIGWRVSRYLYIVILSREQLEGTHIHG
jgi:hypothetical protein